VIVHRIEGMEPGVYLFPRDGSPLSPISSGDHSAAARAACCDQATGGDGAFTVAMVAPLEPVLRDEGAWAYRRLHWEAGAVAHALYLEAEAVGAGATAMGCYLDDELHAVLGVRPALQVVYTLAVGVPVVDPALRAADPYRHRR
jgi:hypothetical protein